MRRAQARVFLLTIALLCGALTPVASASTLQLVVAEDKTTGYNRSLFKHWIDADKDGCNTRAEVLIEESVVKPKIGPKCKLTGGEWVSSYDGKKVTNAAQLDVDHLVPLAEAWRSGAWKWSAAERQAYANDLENSEALIAVTLTTNRAKGDKDPYLWTPSKNYCEYLSSWLKIKSKYNLTVDTLEWNFFKVASESKTCSFGDLSFDTNAFGLNSMETPIATIGQLPTNPSDRLNDNFTWVEIFVPKYDVSNPDQYKLSAVFSSTDDVNLRSDIIRVCHLNSKTGPDLLTYFGTIPTTPITIYCATNANKAFYFNTIARPLGSPKLFVTSPKIYVEVGIVATASTTPTPSATPQTLVVTPGAFCSPTGAIGKSSSGVTYTCKSSPTDTRNRWRQ
jgi:hypothetical protein